MLGFAGVSNVRAGKSYRFAVQAPGAEEARAAAEDLCMRLLTNPVIEESVITVEPPAPRPGGPGGSGGEPLVAEAGLDSGS